MALQDALILKLIRRDDTRLSRLMCLISNEDRRAISGVLDKYITKRDEYCIFSVYYDCFKTTCDTCGYQYVEHLDCDNIHTDFSCKKCDETFGCKHCVSKMKENNNMCFKCKNVLDTRNTNV